MNLASFRGEEKACVPTVEPQGMLLFADGALAGFLRHQTIWTIQVRLDPAGNWAYPLHSGLWESHLLEAPDAASGHKPKSCIRRNKWPPRLRRGGHCSIRQCRISPGASTQIPRDERDHPGYRPPGKYRATYPSVTLSSRG